MSRLLSTIKNDVLVQVRCNLYAISAFASAILAVAISQISNAEHLPIAVAGVMLFIMGGATWLYVGTLIVFEKDEGTINASIVSPLTTTEYIWSKVVTLTGLAIFEALIMIGGAMLILALFTDQALIWPNIFVLAVAALAIGAFYTLGGFVAISRYRSITKFILPSGIILTIMQMPMFYFMGISDSLLWLIIPTSPFAVLSIGAYEPLATWQWLYAIGYSGLLVTMMIFWAHHAFKKNIVLGLE